MFSVPIKRIKNTKSATGKIVTLPEDYYFSSAKNYAGLENELEVVLLDIFLIFILGTDYKSALSGTQKNVIHIMNL
jgi:hypothetical protein